MIRRLISVALLIALLPFVACETQRGRMEYGRHNAECPAVNLRAQTRDADGHSGNRHAAAEESNFASARRQPLSTFSVDVDTASWTQIRRLEHSGRPVPRDAVRIEEMLNFFEYSYAGPDQAERCPVATHLAVTDCPWADGHQLVRVALKAKSMADEARSRAHLTFLLDVSGSMQGADRLDLAKEGMLRLLDELNPDDRVSLVTYAGDARVVLEGVPVRDGRRIRAAVEGLHAGGSTAGSAGLKNAYRLADEYFVLGGVNRVLLCTDGDLNVGPSSDRELLEQIRSAANSGDGRGVYLSVFGFGQGNLNDAMMEKVSDAGNGTYAYVDGPKEVKRLFARQVEGTLVAVAKDVKLQVEFNPARVASYRLIGYDNRRLAAGDFKDDRKDAGDMGAGQAVTALYEIVPVGHTRGADEVEEDAIPLRYQPGKDVVVDREGGEVERRGSTPADELMTLKLRWKPPQADADPGSSRERVFRLADEAGRFQDADADFRFAAAVAAFGMLLQDSPHAGDATLRWVERTAAGALGRDRGAERAEFVRVVEKARRNGRD